MIRSKAITISFICLVLAAALNLPMRMADTIVYAQDVAKNNAAKVAGKEDKTKIPAVVTIQATEVVGLQDLQIQAIAAELELTRMKDKFEKDFAAQKAKSEAASQAFLNAAGDVATKHGIPKEKLSEYDITKGQDSTWIIKKKGISDLPAQTPEVKSVDAKP